jgi:hypothetical protein
MTADISTYSVLARAGLGFSNSFIIVEV